jgi:hypothetical protein
VGNDKNTSLEVLEGLDEGGEGLSVEVVGWLVQHDDVCGEGEEERRKKEEEARKEGEGEPYSRLSSEAR